MARGCVGEETEEAEEGRGAGGKIRGKREARKGRGTGEMGRGIEVECKKISYEKRKTKDRKM